MSDEKNAVVVSEEKRISLAATCAEKFGIDESRMFDLVSKTMVSKNGQVTREEVAMVMHAMNKYDKDPIMKQIHAFESKGKLQIMMGYDGWVDEVNKAAKRGFLGITFTESTNTVVVPGTKLNVPEWVEATGAWVDGANKAPTVYRAYFAEWFVPGDNWRSRPFHRIRMKAYCQCAREALGIGLSDPIDKDQFDYMDRPVHEAATEATQDTMDALAAAVGGAAMNAEDADYVTVSDEDDQPQNVVHGHHTNEEINDLALKQMDGHDCDSPGEPPDAPASKTEGVPAPADTGKAVKSLSGDSGAAAGLGGEGVEDGSNREVPEPPSSPAVKNELCCSIALCQKTGGMRCGVCGERFCSQHMGENGMCKICGQK